MLLGHRGAEHNPYLAWCINQATESYGRWVENARAETNDDYESKYTMEEILWIEEDEDEKWARAERERDAFMHSPGNTVIHHEE